MRHSALSTCLAAALSAAAPCGQIASGAAEKPPARPNIVLIMADDMG